MAESRAHIFFAWVALLSHLVFGTASVQGLVLCIETDGGMNIEAALNGLCASSQPPGRAKAPASSSVRGPNTGESHCGSCQDIPLPAISANDEVFLIGTAKKMTPLSSGAPLSASVYYSQPATNLTRLARQTLPPALVALRTVILLI